MFLPNRMFLTLISVNPPIDFVVSPFPFSSPSDIAFGLLESYKNLLLYKFLDNNEFLSSISFLEPILPFNSPLPFSSLLDNAFKLFESYN